VNDTKLVTKQVTAEIIGTFLLVLFGTGSVAAAVFTDAHVGLWQVAVIWGFGVTIAIYVTASVSGAHLNPAVSLAFALLRRKEFAFTRMFAYWGGQLIGAILAGVAVLALFHPAITRFESLNGISRGDAGSEASAMAFGEYFPNPAMFTGETFVSPLHAFAVEAFGTAVLVLVIFALVEKRNVALQHKGLAPFFIGFTVAVLIALFAPLTQAGWNPARDFGPRVVAFIAGWEDIAIPGPRGGFWVYILGPLVGGPFGGLVYDFSVRLGLGKAYTESN
tara:strand:+ start:758 stop:1588 length:831 start_codon:yes stop_codon:yes gene_type:complete